MKIGKAFTAEHRLSYGKSVGIVLTLILALIATGLGRWIPIIGGPVFGIMVGLVVKSAFPLGMSTRPGIAFCSKKLLQLSIILLGTGLSLGEIIKTGSSSLIVMLGTFFLCLVAAWAVGRSLKISGDLTTLIGVGTAICGASAIAAVSPVIDADDQDVAYAVSTIFLFNIAAVLIFPPLGHALGMSQDAFGLWAGTAINDTSSVVAAATTYGPQATLFATIVKLTRSTLIIPSVLLLGAVRTFAAARQPSISGADAPQRRLSITRVIPWFIVWFLAAALFHTVGAIPTPVVTWATQAAKFLIVVALTAVGLSANLRQIVRTGVKPLLLGLILWGVVAVSSIVIQQIT